MLDNLTRSEPWWIFSLGLTPCAKKKPNPYIQHLVFIYAVISPTQTWLTACYTSANEERAGPKSSQKMPARLPNLLPKAVLYRENSFSLQQHIVPFPKPPLKKSQHTATQSFFWHPEGHEVTLNRNLTLQFLLTRTSCARRRKTTTHLTSFLLSTKVQANRHQDSADTLWTHNNIAFFEVGTTACQCRMTHFALTSSLWYAR